MTDTQASAIGIDEFAQLTADALPMAHRLGFRAETIGHGTACVRMVFDPQFVRPGGTISGPALMALTDYGMYAALMGAIGRVEMALTTNLNINFLRKPAAADIVADCRVIKLGRTLAVLDVMLYSDGDERPVAHATGTYAIPPDTGADT
ncbi:MAG: PaaI family thioesterase [Alphaproteobacteria bacterium]